MAQDAGRLYRAAGGRYAGPKTKAQRSLAKWTREEWTTATGKPACRVVRGKRRCDRYLPKKAWAKLTAAEKAATRRVKFKSSKKYVPNTKAAKRASRYARTK